MSTESRCSTPDLDRGFTLAGFRVFPDRHLIIDPERGVHRLEPKVMAVLTSLARGAGTVVSRDHLIDTVWGSTGATGDLVSRAVGQVRRALSNASGPSPIVETIRGRGYCLHAEVAAIPPLRSTPPRPGPIGRIHWRSSIVASGLSFAAVGLWLLLICSP